MSAVPPVPGHLPPDGGGPVDDGGGADHGGEQVGVQRQDVRPAASVQLPRELYAVHRGVHCNNTLAIRLG